MTDETLHMEVPKGYRIVPNEQWEKARAELDDLWFHRGMVTGTVIRLLGHVDEWCSSGQVLPPDVKTAIQDLRELLTPSDGGGKNDA